MASQGNLTTDCNPNKRVIYHLSSFCHGFSSSFIIIAVSICYYSLQLWVDNYCIHYNGAITKPIILLWNIYLFTAYFFEIFIYSIWEDTHICFKSTGNHLYCTLSTQSTIITYLYFLNILIKYMSSDWKSPHFWLDLSSFCWTDLVWCMHCSSMACLIYCFGEVWTSFRLNQHRPYATTPNFWHEISTLCLFWVARHISCKEPVEIKT